MNLNGDILNNLFPFLEQWGYAVLFFSALFESLPAVGSILPGHTIVMIGGFLVKLGVFDLGDIILLAALGAVIGDLVSYFLGRNYGYPFIVKYGKKLLLKMKYFDKARSLFDANAGKAIIIGRLNLVTRSFMALVAGASGVKYLKFIIYDIIACLLWAAIAVFIGYIFGQSYELVASYFGKYFFWATIISLAIGAAYYYLNKKRQTFLTKHFRYLLLNIFSLYIFAKIVEDIFTKESIIKLDFWLNEKVVLLWQPWLNKIIILVTDILAPINLAILTLLLLAFFIYRKRWYYFILYSAGLYGGLFWGHLFKIVIERSRPLGSLVVETGYSFPSEHTVAASIFFALLIYSFKDSFKSKLAKDIFVTANVVILLLGSLSRVYLKVHWLSDVIAGFALGLFWLTLLILIFKLVIQLYKDKLEIVEKKINEFIINLGK